jgi:hypothetical protein
MSRRAALHRALFVLLVLLSHHASAWGLARWDAGDRLLAGGLDRWLSGALLLAFFALRLLSVVGLPLLVSWWCASALARQIWTEPGAQR